MAFLVRKLTIMQASQVRYSCGCSPMGGYAMGKIDVSKLPNHITICAVENNSPTVRLSIQFQAGSRHENYSNLGASHMLRTAAGLSTVDCSQYFIMRNIQQSAATIYCSGDREMVTYTLEGPIRAVEDMTPFLTTVATRQAFKSYEVQDQTSRIETELARRSPQVHVLDLLHKAAYRYGLGNSLYVSKPSLERFNSEKIENFASTALITGKTVVVGLGICEDKLFSYCKYLHIREGSSCFKSSPFYGGEIREDKGGKYTYIGLGIEGAGMLSEAWLTIQLLKKILGEATRSKYTKITTSMLAKEIKDTDDEHFGITAFNCVYCDSSLFGVLIACPKDMSASLIESGLKAMRALASVTEKDITRAKNQLKYELFSIAEAGRASIDALGRQAICLGKVSGISELAAKVDKISLDNINDAVNKMIASKLAIASVGNLYDVPYLSELSSVN